MKNQKVFSDVLDSIVKPQLNSLFPGCIIGCATSTNSFVKAFGTQDGVTPMHSGNVFDVASVTKAVLNTLVLKIVPPKELDQKISDLIPMEGKFRNLITPRHLLTFSVEYGDVRLSAISKKEDLLKVIFEGDLALAPGTTYRYTNISSMLLGFWLEKRFNQPLEILIDKHVFGRLGMSASYFWTKQNPLKQNVIPTEYVLERGVLQDESSRIYNSPTGSAGIFSSMNDLILFGQSFLGEETYLPKEVIAQMSQSQLGNHSALTFGLGMGLRHHNECDLCDENGVPLIVLKKNGYSGIHFCVLPENDFCFIVFANICYKQRPTAEKRDLFTQFHRKLLRVSYEYMKA